MNVADNKKMQRISMMIDTYSIVLNIFIKNNW